MLVKKSVSAILGSFSGQYFIRSCRKLQNDSCRQLCEQSLNVYFLYVLTDNQRFMSQEFLLAEQAYRLIFAFVTATGK